MKDKRQGYAIHDQYDIYFLTFTIVGWVDVFTRKETKHIILESLKYCVHEKGLVIYGYVIMTNHLHILVRAKQETSGLSDIVRDFKKFTSKKIIEWVLNSSKESRKEWMQMIFKYHAKFNSNNKTYQVWQNNNRPKKIVLPRFATQKLNYIHYNAVRAGFVDRPEDYIYSSYRAYYCEERDIVLPVSKLEFGSEQGFLYI